ncbi:SulP family inorganic anion transporter [Chitiniphilus purpureus]|uniref:SulP family inorganic anion transporter n=1 Tax=Chitiniphilus purpureus TaxID=2981137 RepID=A0ABY6DMV4_9NEIS|nr:SulP family inorganic anion transporter [Chitiniphilus sp. CD1]UXY14436.1 SulP family inorganic anion transporter [Chitiniphilus sp. CD1]
MAEPHMAARWLPILAWLPAYRRRTLAADLAASTIVALLLIPQSIAYALLAGLPPQAGLYASTLPLLAYAVFGSGMTQSVGPAALGALMTASALAPLVAAGRDPLASAALLAVLSGLMLAGCGLLGLGRIAYFLSRPVVSGFTSGTALLIAFGQLGPLLQIPLDGELVPGLTTALVRGLAHADPAALAFGLGALLSVTLAAEGLPRLLRALGCPPQPALWAGRLAPLAVLAALSVVAAWADGRYARIGALPPVTFALSLPPVRAADLAALWLPALLIGLVGFLQSITVAHSMALARGEQIDPDQELLALGAANVAAGAAGGMPVSGSLSRTAVNASAGARTPLAGAFTALWIALAARWAGPWLAELPRAALAATIIVAALKLVDWSLLRATWQYDRRDTAALIVTLLLTLGLGALPGIASGVLLSLALFIHRTSQAQVVIVGRLPGTEHFRNIDRFETETWPGLLLLRVDDSLYFGNTRALAARVAGLLATQPATHDVVLILSGVASIDFSAAEGLAQLDEALRQRGVRLHLAELKMGLRARLVQSGLLDPLLQRVFLSAQHAVAALTDPTPTPVDGAPR